MLYRQAQKELIRLDFLSNAIFSAQDRSLLGVILTRFHPDFYTGRSETRLYTLEELERDYEKLRPRGFALQENGKLVSDTSVGRILADSVFQYMEDECSTFGQRPLDITDLVLLGVEENGFVLAGYQNEMDWGVFVSFKRMLVSDSSFNIYARYMTADGEFRTLSLLNLEDGSARTIYVAFPETTNLTGFGNKVMPCGAAIVEEQPYNIYKCELGLSGYYTNVGEAFLNYLAYNISYYNIGEDLLRNFRDNVSPPQGPSSKSDSSARIRRTPKVNVSIKHVYKETRLGGIMGCLKDPQMLEDFIHRFPEAEITRHWLFKCYNSPWFLENVDKMPDKQALYIASVNLLPICRKERLKYALELLMHRYYINLIGPMGDMLPLILHGGGVDGESIKRVDFWNG